MEESPSSSALGGKITGITFSLSTRQEICKSSINDCAITHASQLSNPFLGLPLEVGKCESCGTSEPGQCEGHFGYIELPIPVYHPDHVAELKRMLSLLCIKCLKIKNRKLQVKNVGVIERMLSSCCEEGSQVALDEVKNEDGASYLVLKVPSRKQLPDNFWNFLEKYGFRYGDKNHRPLIPSEVMTILRKIPADTRKKLLAKGYFPQEGYVLQYLPVPPNCLSVPDISDGTNIMSRDHSISLLKRVLKQIEVIKNSRSGMPNFESHQIEANDLQAAIAQYFQFRGTGKASRDVDTRFGVNKESNTSSTKAWLEKMKTLFIRKSSGFSSRSVITGDPYIGVNEIGLPLEIAQKITFEERVSQHNMKYLQKLVDDKLCLTYRDGMSTYSLREGSKGHTFLRPGQVVHRRIMDGDMVFINRPPTTHKHSLQALSVYIHDDHTVKINPLICGPLSADFDGDCIHLFYPQSLAARAEVLELFSVEKQLLSSHTGNFNLQMTTDSLLSLKLMFKKYFFGRITAQQLMMFVPTLLPKPAVIRYCSSGPLWTVLQMLQAALPPSFDSSGERYVTHKNELVKFDFNRDLVQSTFTDIVTSILFSKGPKEVIRFFNSLTPLLMENVHSEGFSICLEDFYISKASIEKVQESLKKISPLLYHLHSSESVQLQMKNYLRGVRLHILDTLLRSSAIGFLIDSKSESALIKMVQQIGFLGMQLSDKGQFYSKTLVSDLALLFQRKYPSSDKYPSEEFGLVRSCLFHGLDPYQEMVHSISSREVIVRSTRGLTEPGTLFKNLMAILRDVVICYDGTVRNVCANSIIQFEYGTNGFMFNSDFGAGEPVGVLAATAMSNPAYKAVLDSSPSSNSSWEMMKEILLCSVNFKNEVSDRRVILYLKDCDCGRNYCSENAAYTVKNQLRKVSLKDAATELLIEYREQLSYESSEIDNGLVGHIHLNEALMKSCNISLNVILSKCEETISSLKKRKKTASMFKRVTVQVSECCSFQHSSKSKPAPCLTILQGASNDDHLEQRCHYLAEEICPPLLETVIKGDPRVSTVDIIWINPDTPTWIRSPCKSQKGELALDVVLEKHSAKQTGDSWRVVMDSCLPVMHLIDTNRSIPYAIKQVQELLGISCAFEQAVQRLSTSVTMVTKGVLKDHLVLLANSMTCAGNLIGFNIGGIKALSQSLNVQVPFMQATLSAPRKCFERAAEKCHVDSLSSVVASCSWGKQVAVGTGSAFDLLLDTRKVDLSEPDGVDVYDFLQLVSGSTGEETSTACLGAEIEHLDLDDEAMHDNLSPVRDSGQPIFEDTLEFDDRLAKEGFTVSNSSEHDWKRDPPQTAELSGGWEQAKKGQTNGVTTMASDSAWSGWGNGAVKEEPLSNSQWNAKPHAVKDTCDWEAASDKAHGIQISGAASDAAWSSWGSVAAEALQQKSSKYGEWGTKEPPSIGKQLGSSSVWGKKFDSERNSPSNVKTIGGWDQKIDEGQTGVADRAASGSGWSSWGTVQVIKEDSLSNKVQQISSDRDEYGTEETRNTDKQSGPSSAWGQKFDSGRSSPLEGWNKRIDKGQNVEAYKSVSDSGWSNWGSRQVVKEDSLSNKLQQNSPNHEKCSIEEPQGTIKQSESSSFGEINIERNSMLGGWDQKIDKGLNVEAHISATNSGWSNWGQGTSKQSVPSSAWEKKIDVKRGDSPLTAKTSGDWKQAAEEVHDVATQTAAADSSKSNCRGGEAKKEDELSKSAQGGPIKFHEWGAKDSDKLVGSSWGKRVTSNDAWRKKDEHQVSASPMAPNHSDFSNKDTDAVHIEDTLPARIKEGSLNSDVETINFENDEEKNKSAGAPSWGGRRDAQSQWGQKKWSKGDANKSYQSWGSSKSGEWKKKRDHPTKAVDNFKTSGIVTLTKQRLDLFTVEEHDVLSEAEQIMQNIRRIMHQTGYNDGDPLSADDQSYIADYVLNYHPDKALKIGAGIQYIMVSKHANFQDTRCFYVVSTDNHKQDFSYRKSLENFIRGKYPDKAEAFLEKYFKRPKPRPGWTREPPSTEAGTQAEQ